MLQLFTTGLGGHVQARLGPQKSTKRPDLILKIIHLTVESIILSSKMRPQLFAIFPIVLPALAAAGALRRQAACNTGSLLCCNQIENVRHTD